MSDQLTQAGGNGQVPDHEKWDEETWRHLMELDDPSPPPPREERDLAPELDAFLAEPDPEYDWLVEGLIERGDRVCLTGPEGGGKSTFFRQFAVQLSSGIHPFTLEAIPPLRVLLIDFENGRRHVRRELRKLRAKAGDHYQGCMYLEVLPEGMNLDGHPIDVQWLQSIVRLRTPDLLCIGPAYKMTTGNPNDETTVRAAQVAIDSLRTEANLSVMLELHTGHGLSGGARPTRPIGASAWLRWPEFGLHLGETGALTHWRGARDERQWPPALKRGGAWPWSTATAARDNLWAAILGWVDQHGRTASIRTLETELQVDKSAIQRCLAAHQKEWDQLKQSLGAVE